MVATIHTWRANPLATMFDRRSPVSNTALFGELRATMRRVFAQAIVVQMYTAPYHRFVEIDELGQWADDGGKEPE